MYYYTSLLIKYLDIIEIIFRILINIVLYHLDIV